MYKKECVAKFLKNVHRKPKTFYMDALGNDVFKNFRLYFVDDFNFLCYANLDRHLFISVHDLNQMIQKQFYKRVSENVSR